MPSVGLFKHPVRVFDASGSEIEVVEAWVDTSSSYTWLPASVRERLGIVPRAERVFVLADGRRERRRVAQVRISLGDELFSTYCAFAEEGEECLLGVIALEEAGLAVDPVNRRLVPAESYALTAL